MFTTIASPVLDRVTGGNSLADAQVICKHRADERFAPMFKVGMASSVASDPSRTGVAKGRANMLAALGIANAWEARCNARARELLDQPLTPQQLGAALGAVE